MNTIYKIFALAVLVCAGQQAMAQISFTQTTYPLPSSGGFPGTINGTFIKAADFNNDGWQDLAMVDAGGPLRVLLNTGNGLFAPQQSYQILPVSDGAVNMDLGDFNEDGNIDIVVSPSNAFAFGVGAGIFYGTSTGTFNPIVFPSAPVCQSIIVGDFNNDNHDDILSTFGIFGSVLLGDGAGNFTTNALPAGTTGINMSILDLNQDGNSDIIHQNSGAVWYSSLGDGNGVLTLFTGITTGDTYAIAGDLNGDNIPDLISKNCCNIRVYAGLGDGSFQTTPFAAVVPANNIGQILDVKIGDINNDGNNDIIETHRASTGSSRTFVGVFLGDGAGNFGASTLVAASPPATFQDFTQFELADFNNDGKIDIAAMDRGSSIVHILTNSTPFPPTITFFTPTSGPIGTTVTITGTNFNATPANNIVYFGATRAAVTAATATQLTVTVPSGATYQPITVQVAGLTCSSKDPFVTTFTGGGSIDVCSFAPQVNLGTTPGNFNRGTLGDADGDGKMDLIIPSGQGSSFISIYRNISTTGTIVPGSFASAVNFTTGTDPMTVSFGDLDSDGKPDLATISVNGGGISVFKNLSTPGTIVLAAKVDFAVGGSTDIAISDIDGDGKQDISVTTSAVGLTVFRNTGSPGVINSSTFAAGVSFSAGANPFPFTLGDIDGDGKIDAVVPDRNAYTVSILRNTSIPGTVSFAALVPFITATGSPGAGQGAAFTSLGDIDGDSKIDLLVSNPNINTVAIYRNTSSSGIISFAARFDLTTTFWPVNPTLSDLDGDGKVDLTIDLGGAGANTIAIYKNTSTSGTINASSFGAPVTLATPSSRIFLAGDIDGDGRNELVSTYGTVSASRNVIGTILPPTIASFTPSSGLIGTSVTITGTNFSTPFSNTVEFNGIPATITASSATTITVNVPTGATTGLIEVTIGCNKITSASNFMVGVLIPTITSFAPNSGPIGTTVTITGTNFDPVAANNDVKFNGVSALTPSAASLTSLTVIVPIGATTGPISVTTSAGTASSSTNFTVTCVPPPAPSVPSVSRCESGTITLTATGATGTQEYRWYDVVSGGTSLSSLATFTILNLTTTTPYYVSIFDVATSCESNRTQVDAIVNTPPAAPGVTGNSGCSGTSISVSATGGSAGQYRWYTIATGGTPDAAQTNDTFVSPTPLTANTSFWVSINNGTCESNRTEVIATVIPLPTAPNVQPVNPVCPGSDVTLTATGGIDGQYRWYEGATIIPGEVNSTLMVSNITGPRNFQAALNDGICESNKNSASVTLKNCTPPVIAPVTATAFLEGEVEIDLCALISDPENDLDLTTLQATGTLTSGAPFTISGCTLSINYAGVPFPGTDALTIEVCDLTGLCTVQTITIELGGDINVFNALSPNGDGKNEFLTIQYIDILPETQNNNVFIYNRWGDEVFSVNNYNNADRVFKGDNKNGNKLPTGSYYYKIVFPNGKKPITGFLELKY